MMRPTGCAGGRGPGSLRSGDVLLLPVGRSHAARFLPTVRASCCARSAQTEGKPHSSPCGTGTPRRDGFVYAAVLFQTPLSLADRSVPWPPGQCGTPTRVSQDRLAGDRVSPGRWAGQDAGRKPPGSGLSHRRRRPAPVPRSRLFPLPCAARLARGAGRRCLLP